MAIFISNLLVFCYGVRRTIYDTLNLWCKGFPTHHRLESHHLYRFKTCVGRSLFRLRESGMEKGGFEHHGPLPSPLYLERRDFGRNMARFYRVSVGVDLFGALVLERCFGRIGTRGRVLLEPVGGKDVALLRMDALLRQKARRGYRVVGGRETGIVLPVIRRGYEFQLNLGKICMHFSALVFCALSSPPHNFLMHLARARVERLGFFGFRPFRKCRRRAFEASVVIFYSFRVNFSLT